MSSKETEIKGDHVGDRVKELVRDLESSGVDADRITVETDMAGTMEETLQTGTIQLARPLRRAGRGLVIGLVVGAVVGATVGQTSSRPFAWILMLGIAGALVTALSALYSGLSMSSTAYDADGSHRATIRIKD